MNTDSESSSNSRILPFFMVILVLMGAYAFEKRRIRTLSLQSKAQRVNGSLRSMQPFGLMLPSVDKGLRPYGEKGEEEGRDRGNDRIYYLVTKEKSAVIPENHTP